MVTQFTLCNLVRTHLFASPASTAMHDLTHSSAHTATQGGAPRPMRVMFMQTSMPVGGAETLLVNLIERLDRRQFAPEVCCLKERGPLGEELANMVPVHHSMIAGKWDLRVLWRLVKLMSQEKIEAVITVGAGDKMFWGRLAARLAGVPVVASALHSTGWPDGVGRLNHLLTPVTDAFIGVADSHGEFLSTQGGFPREKVVVIPNGIDTDRFAPMADTAGIRQELGLSATAPVVGILAALRPEKNHELFLAAAAQVSQSVSDAQFVIIGDGACRPQLESLANELNISDAVHFLGNRSDVPRVLAAMDVVALTSHNEANPVSILEAMSTGKPVVATDVGSIKESVNDGVTGYLVPPGDLALLSERLIQLCCQPLLAQEQGAAGREWVVANGSLQRMVSGYEELLQSLYTKKTGQPHVAAVPPSHESDAEPTGIEASEPATTAV